MFSFYSFTSSSVFNDQTPNTILGSWTCQKSEGGENANYISTPKTLGYTKKIVFTSDNKVITYKNDVELRISKYVISKGISVYDNKEHDVVIFEGLTYLIENPDSKTFDLQSEL